MSCRWSAALLAGALLSGAEVSGPVLGLVHDPESGAVLPARGIPGSAYFGQAVLEGYSDARAAAGTVLGLTPDAQAKLTRDGQTAGLGLAERIALSPSGSAAALWSRSAAAIRTFLHGEFSSEFAFAGEIASLAVSDDATAAIAVSDGSLYLLSADHGMAELGPGKAAAFARGSRVAVAALESQVARIQEEGRIDLLFPMAAVSAGIEQDRVVAVSGDGKVAVWTPAEGLLELSCDCRPDMLEPLSQGIWRITKNLREPVWTLDLQGREPRLVFIPAARGANE